MSGRPFEFKARLDGEGVDLHRFNKPLLVEINYADMNIPAGREADLTLYWYNPESGGWEGIMSYADPATQTLRAYTKLSVFDMGVNDWRASHLPTVN